MAISLQKGQAISLEKTAGKTLTRVKMALGWDVAKKKGFLGGLFGGKEEIDLDASCMLFDQSNAPIELVFFGQLKSKDGSIRHGGDNLTGAGDGDDEVIYVNLEQLPSQIKTLVFTVSSFRGQTFAQVENAYCRLVDDTNQSEVARFNLSAQGQHTGQIMARLTRNGNDWELKALGENSSSRTAHDLVPAIQRLI
jgi:tellurium resistance protein TerZ